jgi:hypothetical protein
MGQSAPEPHRPDFSCPFAIMMDLEGKDPSRAKGNYVASLVESEDDVGAKFVHETRSVQVDPAVERRLLWKIDLVLMPLLTISYGLQYVRFFFETLQSCG